MQFKAPHWLIIIAGSLAAILSALAGQPLFAPEAQIFGMLASIFTIIAGATGIASHSAISPRPSSSTVVNATLMETRTDAAVTGRTGSNAGFGSLRALVSAAVFGLFLLACAAFRAVEPAAQTLEQCAANYIEAHLGLDWVDFAVQGALACGVDLVDFVKAIADSKDLSVAQYGADARAALADPAIMRVLRVHYNAARPQTRDAGSDR